MEDLLTTKEVQELLKINRITVYRMLQDGRINGVKIGQQWRFPASEIEALISKKISDQRPKSQSASSAFPSHCVQSVQNLFADMVETSAVILDPHGNPLTSTSNPCMYCSLLHEIPIAKKVCEKSWADLASRAFADHLPTAKTFQCHAGLSYTAALILENEQPVAVLLTGQFLSPAQKTARRQQTLRQFANKYDIDDSDLQNSINTVPVMTEREIEKLTSMSQKAAKVVNSILQERSQLVKRLQSIAEISSL